MLIAELDLDLDPNDDDFPGETVARAARMVVADGYREAMVVTVPPVNSVGGPKTVDLVIRDSGNDGDDENHTHHVIGRQEMGVILDV